MKVTPVTFKVIVAARQAAGLLGYLPCHKLKAFEASQ